MILILILLQTNSTYATILLIRTLLKIWVLLLSFLILISDHPPRHDSHPCPDQYLNLPHPDLHPHPHSLWSETAQHAWRHLLMKWHFSAGSNFSDTHPFIFLSHSWLCQLALTSSSYSNTLKLNAKYYVKWNLCFGKKSCKSTFGCKAGKNFLQMPSAARYRNLFVASLTSFV